MTTTATAFDAATTLQPHGDGRYAATIDPGWAIGDRPHGGYLLALVARAGIAELGPDYPHPLGVSAHFVSSPERGATVELRTEVLRRGRSAGQVAVSMRDSEGRRCVELLLAGGTLRAGSTPWYEDSEPVPLPPAEHCHRVPVNPPGGQFELHLNEFVDQRLDPSSMGNGRAEVRAWSSLADGSDWDPLSLLVAMDGLPPVTMMLGSLGWVPTIEFSAQLRALPAPGPIRLRQWGRLVQDGWLDETCEAWDSTGRLVGHATQLAGVRVADHLPVGGPLP